MRYAIIVSGKVTEPTDIPPVLPLWAANKVEFCEKVYYPKKIGWVQVSDDAVPGAIYNGGGSSTNPPLPPSPPAPPVNTDKTAAAFEAWAIARTGSVAAWQDLIEKCIAHIGTGNNDKEVRYFPRWALLTGDKSKANFQARCTPLTLTPTPIISAAALTAALAEW